MAHFSCQLVWIWSTMGTNLWARLEGIIDFNCGEDTHPHTGTATMAVTVNYGETQ